MSPKIITTIIVVLILLIAGLFGSAYYISRDTGVSTTEVLQNILPFGQGTSVPNIPSTPIGTPDEAGSQEPRTTDTGQRGESSILQIQKLVADPVAGATIDEKSPSNVRLFYADRATGNIFSLEAKTGSIARLTNTTIPGVEEAVWGENKVILRYLDENGVIKSFSGSFATGTTSGNGVQELRGRFLPNDSAFLVSSPDKKRIFYLSLFGSSILGTITNFEGGSARQIFESTHAEWLPEWIEEGTITMTTKASAFVPGSLYFLDTVRETMQKVLGGKNGLTTKTSPGKNHILLSEASENSFQTLLYTQKTKASAFFPLRTLPEKCVWSKGSALRIYCAAPLSIPVGAYPDDWYQGIISFSDNLWEVNVDTGAVSLLSRPQESAREEIDVINPFLSRDESYLFFMNKKDGSLWSLRLK